MDEHGGAGRRHGVQVGRNGANRTATDRTGCGHRGCAKSLENTAWGSYRTEF